MEWNFPHLDANVYINVLPALRITTTRNIVIPRAVHLYPLDIVVMNSPVNSPPISKSIESGFEYNSEPSTSGTSTPKINIDINDLIQSPGLSEPIQSPGTSYPVETTIIKFDVVDDVVVKAKIIPKIEWVPFDYYSDELKRKNEDGLSNKKRKRYDTEIKFNIKKYRISTTDSEKTVRRVDTIARLFRTKSRFTKYRDTHNINGMKHILRCAIFRNQTNLYENVEKYLKTLAIVKKLSLLDILANAVIYTLFNCARIEKAAAMLTYWQVTPAVNKFNAFINDKTYFKVDLKYNDNTLDATIHVPHVDIVVESLIKIREYIAENIDYDFTPACNERVKQMVANGRNLRRFINIALSKL